MKRIHTFESFLNEQLLNEANLPQTIEDMEKVLPKVVNIVDFLKEWERYAGPFSGSLTINGLLKSLDRNFDMKNIILSQGQYVTYQKKQYEGGYGGISKPIEAKADYDRLINDEDYEKLIRITRQSTTPEKFYKKIAAELQKSLGPLEAAKRVLRYVWSSANDSYDRSLIMDKLFTKYGEQLWHDKTEVHNSVGRGSFGRNAADSSFRDYLINIV
jgi:hypothetical protein